MIDLSRVKKITIPEGEVRKILRGTTILWEYCDMFAGPYDGSEEGSIAIHRINVSKGDKITIYYYITEQKGYIYDGRGCGLNYYGTVEGGKYPIAKSDLNKHCSISLTVPQDGFITVGGHYKLVNNGTETEGQLSQFSDDIPVGRYIKIKVE